MNANNGDDGRTTLATATLTGDNDLSEAARRLVEDRNTLALHSLPTRRTPKLMHTLSLPDHKRLKILITGGAGFVGSHLTDKLMMDGHEVTVLDNFFTGSKKNIEHWLHHPNFTLVVHDVTEPIRLVRTVLVLHPLLEYQALGWSCMSYCCPVTSRAFPSRNSLLPCSCQVENWKCDGSLLLEECLLRNVSFAHQPINAVSHEPHELRAHTATSHYLYTGSRPNLPSRLPRLSTSLSVQSRQDY